MKNSINYLIVFMVFIIQVLVIPGTDMMEVNEGVLICLGLLGAIIYRPNKFEPLYMVLIFPIFIYIILGLRSYVSGYTMFLIAKFVGFMAIAYIASRCERKYIFISLIATIPIQAIINYSNIIPWKMEYDGINWGSFRNAIRFSTVIYSGLISCVWGWNYYKGVLQRALIGTIAAIGLYMLYFAHSHTIWAILFITAMVLFYNRKYSYIWVCIAIIALLIICSTGLDHNVFSRVGLWKSVLLESVKNEGVFLTGHGIGSWVLLCGEIGFTNCGHPHNQLLSILFETGLTGVFVSAFSIGGIMFLGLTGRISIAGFIGVTLSTLSNSIEYPSVWLMWSLFAGICINTGIKRYSYEY